MIVPVSSLNEAFAVLGLHGPADAAAVTRAFRVAVKASRSDLPGGDADRFRRVIAAHRLIQSRGACPVALAAPIESPADLPVVGRTPLQALAGGETLVRLGTRILRVRAPAWGRATIFE